MDNVKILYHDSFGTIHLGIVIDGITKTYEYFVDAAMIPEWERRIKIKPFTVLNEVKKAARSCRKVD